MENEYGLRQVQVRLKLAEAEPLYSTEPLNSPDRAVDVMAGMLAQLDRECCCVVNLDNALRPINFNVVSIGGINQAQMPVQNIFKAAILSNAAQVMAFHNHPSGSTNPSREDVLITRKLIEAGRLMDIPVTDHIIVGGGTGERYSFRTQQPWLFEADGRAVDQGMDGRIGAQGMGGRIGAQGMDGRIDVHDAGGAVDRGRKQDKITALLVEPGKHPKTVEIGTDLKSLQDAVGGDSETVHPFEDSAAVIRNGEKKTGGLPMNRALRDENGEVHDIIAGSFLITGLTKEGPGSLSPEQMEKYEKMFHQPEAFIRMGRGVMAVPIPDDMAKPRTAERQPAGKTRNSQDRDAL